MIRRGGLSWIEASRLSAYPWLVHAFSTRKGGSSPPPCAGLNLGFNEYDDPTKVEENRRLFFRQLAGENFVPASTKQVHSSHSFVVARDGKGQLSYRVPGAGNPGAPSIESPAGDGLITAEQGILLTIRIADCLPVLMVDPQKRVVAAVHSGWRGAVARVIEKAVGDMRRVFGSDPKDIIAALGPSIRACCYEVGQEVVDTFHAKFENAERFFQPMPERSTAGSDRHTTLFVDACPPGHAPDHVPVKRLNLIAVAQDQLESAGLKPANVIVTDYCTACRTDLFFSHRQEGGVTGRLIAAIGMK
jgi:polyphenol oxidase